MIKVPYESLKRTTRDRKYMLEELEGAMAGVSSAASQAAAGATVKDEAVAALDSFISKLQGIKRKLESMGEAESAEAQRCKARLEHLVNIAAPTKDEHVSWNRQRVDRLLADHLLRNGYFNAAQQLVRAIGIAPLAELHLFEGVYPVLEALRKRDCGPALDWCAQNQQRLRKLKSKLEFTLRVQGFVELVRVGRSLDAIKHARQHLAPWAGQYMQDLQRATAVLAFRPRSGDGMSNGVAAAYADLFSPSAWEALQDLTLRELYRLNNMPPHSLLEVHLQAGLSALKTHHSYEAGASREDPLSRPEFRRLAEGLPYAKHVHSKLLCSLTKSTMNEHNPPMVLPTGYVYSELAVQRILAEHGGTFVDPGTGETYPASAIRRAYIS